MTAIEVLAEARRRKVVLAFRDGRIVARPAGILPPEIKNAVRGCKPDLLRLLEEQAETARIARLDAERREADRIAKRGYDFDPTAPSQAEYVARTDPLADPSHPAYSIVATCQRYGVALRIDPDGTLVVGKAGAKANEPGQPWQSLLCAIEAHLEAVAQLIAKGWHLRAELPEQGLA